LAAPFLTKDKRQVGKIYSLTDSLILLLRIYYYILIARIILSWFVMGQSDNRTLYDIYNLIYAVTEPLLAPLRKIIPSVKMGMGYLDLSPLILLIIIRLAESFIRTL
jgi:YggT family protein